jgi:hypothetical protein
LWREQISLNRLVVKACDRCSQNNFISLYWLAFLARRTGLTLTPFTGFAWFTRFARWFGLALVSGLFGFACFFGFLRLALLLGGFGFCACTFFLFIATATTTTTATTGTAATIISIT